MNRHVMATLIATTVLCAPLNVQADDQAKTSSEHKAKSSIQLETTSVTGSRELPKVLVIVPWKSSAAVEPTGRPLASLVEDALTPLDPDVFRRDLAYYTDLNTADKQPDGSSKPKPEP